ncbi:MAG TPA: hypothetical protein VIM11_24930 [Tepidisphaeraceae bacterium]|jgi:hypothetical protein
MSKLGFPKSYPSPGVIPLDHGLSSTLRLRPEGEAHATKYLPVLTSALLAVLVYAVTLHGTYIYDDVKIVHTDPRVLEPDRWYQLWTQPFFARSIDKLYRPLVSSSFALENYLHGDRPWIFHLVNILLHATVSASVALLALRLAGVRAAWVAGLLFAVHPVHVEAVAGLVGRAESACALAIILGLWLFLRDGPVTLWRSVALVGCFMAALLSKEQGVLFPLLIVGAYPLKYSGRLSPEDRRRLTYLGIALCWMLVAYLLLRERVASFSWDRNQLDWYVNPILKSQGLDRLMMPVALLGRYTMLLIFPRHLSIDYGGTIIGWTTSLHDPYFVAGLVALTGWFMAVLFSWRRRNYPLLFCLFGLALTYGMVGNIVALIGTIFADRLMYLPSIFFLLTVGIALSKFRPTIIAPVVGVLVVVGGIGSFSYAMLWNDPIALFEYTLRIHPQSERAYGLLADTYRDSGDLGQVVEVAKRACAAVPDRWEPYALLIDAQLAIQDYDAAMAAAEAGLAHVSAKDERLVFIQWEETIARKKAEAAKQSSDPAR